MPQLVKIRQWTGGKDKPGAFYNFARVFLYFWFRSIWRLKIHGQNNVPKKEPVILAANHRSYADPPLVGVSSPRELNFLAKKQLFSFKPFGALIRSLNAYPLNRSGAAGGLKQAQKLLENGKSIVLFPEGGRMKTDNLGPAKAGVGLLSMKSKVPVVPIYIHNSGHLFGLKKLQVFFGKPIWPKGSKTYQELANRVMDSIKAQKKALLEQESR